MPNANRPKKKGPPIKSVLQEFYERAQELTGLTQKICKEVLTEKYGDFDPKRIGEYLAMLRAYAGELREKEALEREEAKKLFNRTLNFFNAVAGPCGITGCDGQFVHVKWVIACTRGGVRHFLACRYAPKADITPDEMLKRIEEVHVRWLKIRQEELDAWHDGMKNETQKTPIKDSAPSEPLEDEGPTALSDQLDPGPA